MHYLSVQKSSLALFAWTSAFFFLLFYVYATVLRRWEYSGLWYEAPTALQLTGCYLIAIAPLWLMRQRIDRFSTFFHWIIYFFVYIPVVLITVLQGLSEEPFALPLTCLASFVLVLAMPKIRQPDYVTYLKPHVFWLLFWAIYAACLGYVLSKFHGQLALVSFFEVYEQRSISSAIVAASFVGYASAALANALNPFLMAYGIVRKHRALFLLGVLGQVLIYSTNGLKFVLLSALVIPVFYLLIFRRDPLAWKLGAIVAASVFLPLLTVSVLDVETFEAVNYLAAIVFVRTYGLVGALTGIYHEFFSAHPYTYLSHVNVVGLFVEYPYDQSIGQVVGASMGSGMNANANFWATDGLASGGLIGVLVIGPILGAALRFVDGLVPCENAKMLCIASIPAAISITNASLFTTFLTGGVLLVMVLCRLIGSAPSPQQRC